MRLEFVITGYVLSVIGLGLLTFAAALDVHYTYHGRPEKKRGLDIVGRLHHVENSGDVSVPDSREREEHGYVGRHRRGDVSRDCGTYVPRRYRPDESDTGGMTDVQPEGFEATPISRPFVGGGSVD